MTFEQKLARLGVTLALVLLTAIGWVSYRSNAEQAEAALLVAHTHEVIDALQRIVSGMSEAESDLRGFAITGDARFLTDFEASIALSEGGAAAAGSLSRDNSAQHLLIRSVQKPLAARVALLRSSLAALRAGARPHVPEEALRLSGRIRDIVEQATLNERALLKDRTRAAADRTKLAQRSVLLGLIASIALVAVASVLIEREMRRRQRSEQVRLRELWLLLELGELLQACRTSGEAFAVIQRLGPQFFPESSGAVSMVLASRNAVDVRSSWGKQGDRVAPRFEPDKCWGLRRGQPHVLGGKEHAISCEHWQPPPPAAALCVPLIANGELLGALHVFSSHDLPDETRERAAVFGEQVALAVANLELRETLRNQSIRDPLTGLFNRRYTEETLQRELSRAARESTQLSVLMLDVDHFKRVNDSYGHEAGDEVLKHIAATLQQQTRGGDVVSRMGGEELLVLLPKSGPESALSKAEALRAKVESLSIRAHGKAIDRVTVSIGVATFPEHGAKPEELFRAADAALYRAKHTGRNRVVSAE